MKNLLNNNTITGSFSAIPDWKTRSVFFVWPHGLDGRNLLVNAYRDIIGRIPPEIDLHIVIRDESFQDGVINKIRSVRPEGSLSFHVIPGVMDIWIRDWAPVPVSNPGGETVLAKATYNPSYLSGKFAHYATADNQAGYALSSVLNLKTVDFPLVWDIGNFTHNGNGTAIVTRRILEDNPHLTEEEIKYQFQDTLGIKHLILIEPEPEDPTGHVDGTVRFLGENLIAVASYPEDHVLENRFCDALARTLSSAPGEDFRIIRIPNGPIDEYEIEGIPSASGNHLNFLRVSDYLFMPCYGMPEDELAMEAIKNICPGITVIPVASKEMITLARRGGVLDCVSWCV